MSNGTTAMTSSTPLVGGNLSVLNAGPIVQGAPLNVSVTLTGAAPFPAFAEDVEVQFRFENIGADVAGSEFTFVERRANINIIGPTPITASVIPFPPVGVYRVAALVRARIPATPAHTGAIILTGFIEGLVIEVGP